MLRRRPFTAAVWLLLLTLFAAACGGGSPDGAGGEGEVAGGSPEADLPTTAAPGATDSAGTPTGPPVAPLTGHPLDAEGEVALRRPAVVAKVDNDAKARPQAGLNEADLVYEVQVEGITRFAAVFHSTDASPIGPIRSARSSDVDIVGNLNEPRFAWSGANPTVIGEVASAQDRGVLFNLSHDVVPDLYQRDPTRPAPHNLFSDIAVLRAAAPASSEPPEPVFRYRSTDEPPSASAVPAAGVWVDFGGDGRMEPVELVWDADAAGWARFQADWRHGGAEAAHLDADGRQVSPENVVVLFVEYTISAAGGGSPQALTVGEGDAVVLTDGQAVLARWVRPTAADPIELRDPDGEPVLLTPGRTWVLLPSPGQAGFLDGERAELLLASR